MKFNGLVKGKILKRYKRFLADVELDNGEIVTAHTANTGSMKTCWEPGWDVLVSYHDDPKRKLKYSLQMTHNGKSWIGINTSLPNKLALEAFHEGLIKEFSHYDSIKPEVKIGKSRIDLLLTKGDERCFVEIKNVTLKDGESTCSFPDSVSTRGQKHLQELIDLLDEKTKAKMLYIVQREDVNKFHPAADIDPEYARLLKLAKDNGVEILVYQCSLSPKEIKINKSIPWSLD